MNAARKSADAESLAETQKVVGRLGQTIPCCDLPEDLSDSPINNEWNFYRRQVGQLLADGHEGR